eukprot:TRINITY_DN55180_c0_g1_i2.p1 TRINITY_DN55180_c0_g1~~TRINITY_DN55180_c0_g1_i2.p1  ORF type:complete len:343 (-),score=47.19 TRINITY_DN55180_c0_g1_i2:73-1101(-)
MHEIRRENVKDWVGWSFWGSDTAEINEQPELDALTNQVAEWVEFDFLPGRNDFICPMRLTMDPVQSSHRPAIYYGVTHICVKAVNKLAMPLLGFQQHTSGTLTYWHRPGATSNTPVVFCHGLGIGTLPYMRMIHKMVAVHCHDRSMFCIELPHISSRINKTVPSAAETVHNISAMLAQHGRIKHAHFIGHSFGSVVLSWAIQLQPTLVARATFIDPVVFLLCKADVLYNFLHKPQDTSVGTCMRYFVGRELFTAHSLSRHFIWHQCILWVEDLVCPDGALVVLSGNDSIVPAHCVKRYLEQGASKPGNKLDVLFLDGMEHAAFLMQSTAMDQVLHAAFDGQG